MPHSFSILIGTAISCSTFLGASSSCFAESQAAVVVCPADASDQETLAAAEIRRYVYLRTGKLLSIVRGDTLPDGADAIVVANKERAIVDALAIDAKWKETIDSLEPQQYVLKTTDHQGRRLLAVIGGDPIGTLYGAYRLAEHFGVRFFLHGDVIPDRRIPLELPELGEIGRPLFALRGVNPWGSHPFGFDQWNADDYKVHIGQLAKMRMNFIGMHCYPEGHPYAEPTVWLGLDGQFDDTGRVKTSYPARYYNTLWNGHWGPMRARPTGEYRFGAALLFERDDWGPDVMRGYCPTPATPEACNDLFNRTGIQFRDAFSFARLVGVKTCLGTESPMVMPRLLRDRLQSQGKDPNDPAVVGAVYEGIFRRIMAAHPLDYYWLWTPEGWTWQGNSTEQMQETVDDVKIALAALKRVDAPFKLATCGWVLGPKDDRAAFDRMVPKEIAISAISRVIGYEPVDPAFGQVEGRPKWAIPWLESDDFLASPQLWVGRTRKDAADALAYGCDGLMGLQWRTRILGPNVSALAQAGWDQSAWNPKPGVLLPNTAPEASVTDGPLGGRTATYLGREIAGTDDDLLYQTCRYDLNGYRFSVPNGRFRVTLKFCEPHFAAAGKRVCDVKLQGKTVLKQFDIFARVGQFAASDQVFENVAVTDGSLRLDIIHRESLPCISAVVIEGAGFTRKINCGGPAYKDYAADGRKLPITFGRGKPRGLASADFYADWARAMFGPEVAPKIAHVFTRIDGRLPHSLGGGCPSGSLRPISQPWKEVSTAYTFVDELARLRSEVRGPGNLERFDYWLDNFRYLRCQAKVQCAMGQFSTAMKRVVAEKDPVARRKLALEVALPAHKAVVDEYGRMVRLVLATVSTNGGLAEVINLHHGAGFWPRAISNPAARLAKELGGPLPDGVIPSSDYTGRPRLIVPTVRNTTEPREALRLKTMVLSPERPASVTLFWRTLGQGPFQAVEVSHIARGVYTVELPAEATAEDLEYYLEARLPGTTLRFPATAPQIAQTVVVIPQAAE